MPHDSPGGIEMNIHCLRRTAGSNESPQPSIITQAFDRLIGVTRSLHGCRAGTVIGFHLSVFSAAFLPGCSPQSLLNQIDEQRIDVADQTAEAAVRTREFRIMRWREAERRLIEHNISIQRSRDRIEELERVAANQWREWLPRPTFYVSLQNSLRDLGDLSSDSISASLIAPLSIPNPLTVQARTYQNALQLVQARDSAELSRRRQVISLYRLFLEWQELEDQQLNDDREITGVRVEQAVENALRRRESVANLEERRNFIYQQFSNILDMPGVNVRPNTASLPEINYESRLDSIRPGHNHGVLATRLAAYEIQGSLLRRRGMRLLRWPNFNVSASTPPFYDSRRPEATVFENAEQILLFGSLSQSFDLTGRQAADIRSAEDNVRYVRKSINQRLDADARQWQRLRQRYGDILIRERMLRGRLESARSRGNSGVPAADDLETVRNINRELDQLKRAKRNLDMEIWLWDDQAWQ